MIKWLLLSGGLGALAGLIAVGYQFVLEGAVYMCFSRMIGLAPSGPVYAETHHMFGITGDFSPWMIIIVPAAGGLFVGILTWLYTRKWKELESTDEIEAFHRKEGRYPIITPFFKLLLSIITLGTGGSGGKEAPCGNAGAACASAMSVVFRLDTSTRRILMVAGVAAGIGAVFRIPIAAAVFAVEFLYASGDIEGEVLIPSAIAGIMGYTVFASFYDFDPLLPIAEKYQFRSVMELFPYTILAVVAAGCGGVFVYLFRRTGKLFSSMKINMAFKPLIGGLITGLIGWALLTLTKDVDVLAVIGDGFGILEEHISGGQAAVGVGILLLVTFAKMVTTSATIGSGGIAGLFTPSLVIGGTLGGAVGLLLNGIMPGLVPMPTAYMIVGMSAFFSSISNTPMCAILIACEVTGNYQLLIPAMWACALSFLLCREWSLYPGQMPSLKNVWNQVNNENK